MKPTKDHVSRRNNGIIVFTSIDSIQEGGRKKNSSSYYILFTRTNVVNTHLIPRFLIFKLVVAALDTISNILFSIL